MNRFHTQSRNRSTPKRGPIPQGNGRDRKGRGMEAVVALLIHASGSAREATRDVTAGASRRWMGGSAASNEAEVA